MLNGIKSFWHGLVGSVSKSKGKNYVPVSGRNFSPIRQFRNPTYITCLELLSKAMSDIRYVSYGAKNNISDFDVFRKVFCVKANKWQNVSEFLRIMEYHRLNSGNAYAYIQWDNRGNLAELVPLDPRRMKVYINDSIDIIDADVIYEYADGKTTMTFLPDELIHVKAFSEDGIIGRPAYDVIRGLLDQSKLSDQYMDEIMNNGYGGVMALEFTSDLTTDRAKVVMAQVKEVLKSQGNRMLAMPPGIKASILGPTSIDSGIIDMNEKVNKEIAAFFGVPLFLLNKESSNGTAGMTSAQASAFYNSIIKPAIDQYAAEFSVKLLTNLQINKGVHFDTSDIAGFSMLNASERCDNFVKLCAGGILTGNEVRSELGFEPYKDEFDSGNKIYRNGAFMTGSGDIGDSIGSKEKNITKRDETQKDH